MLNRDHLMYSKNYEIKNDMKEKPMIAWHLRNSYLCRKSSLMDFEVYFGDIMGVNIFPRWCFTM